MRLERHTPVQLKSEYPPGEYPCKTLFNNKTDIFTFPNIGKTYWLIVNLILTFRILSTMAIWGGKCKIFCSISNSTDQYIIFCWCFSWDFDKYLNEINSAIDDEIFAYPEWISVYYKWCGFYSYNLVIRVGKLLFPPFFPRYLFYHFSLDSQGCIHYLWRDQEEWVICRQYSILIFQYKSLVNLKCYILIQTRLNRTSGCGDISILWHLKTV